MSLKLVVAYFCSDQYLFLLFILNFVIMFATKEKNFENHW